MAKSRTFTTEELKAMGIDVAEPKYAKINRTTPPPKSSWGIKDMFANLKANPTINSISSYMKSKPWTSTFLGMGGAANLAGLFDNNKIGGQLLGGTLGGLATIPFDIAPQGRALAAMLGGGLGSLYDKLAAKKEQEYTQQQQQQMY